MSWAWGKAGRGPPRTPPHIRRAAPVDGTQTGGAAARGWGTKQARLAAVAPKGAAKRVVGARSGPGRGVSLERGRPRGLGRFHREASRATTDEPKAEVEASRSVGGDPPGDDEDESRAGLRVGDRPIAAGDNRLTGAQLPNADRATVFVPQLPRGRAGRSRLAISTASSSTLLGRAKLQQKRHWGAAFRSGPGPATGAAFHRGWSIHGRW